MKMISVFFTLTACLLLLSGCWDKHELEDNNFAVLLGIDAAENSDVLVTVAFPLTQIQGGGLNEGMDNGSGNYSVMSVKAPTVVEGLNMFSTKLSGPLALYSVKTIVISQEIAQGDMLRQVFSSWRYEEIRNTTAVLISECKAAEFIDARIKNSPIDPLRQEELLLEQINDSSYYKPIQLLELLAGLKSDGGGSVAMYGGIAPKNQDDDKQSDKQEKSVADIKEPVKEGYLPAQVPLAADNESRISGLAVFRGAKMAGTLDSMEAQTYSMLTRSGARKTLTVPDPIDPAYDIVAEILPARNNKFRSAIRDGNPVFEIDVELKCNIESIQSGIDYTLPQNYDILTAHLQDICVQNMTSLIAKVQKEYNADVLRLGDKLASHFSTVGEWENYGWPEKYKDAEINLNVTLTIEHTGIMTQ